MPKVRVNYDGWLALPAAVRQKLGLSTGDQLDLEVVGGAVVLRPPKSVVAAESPATELSPAPVQAEPASTLTPSPSEKRGPRRPRKAATPPPAASTVLPPHLKARGAKRKAAPVGEAPR